MTLRALTLSGLIPVAMIFGATTATRASGDGGWRFRVVDAERGLPLAANVYPTTPEQLQEWDPVLERTREFWRRKLGSATTE